MQWMIFYVPDYCFLCVYVFQLYPEIESNQHPKINSDAKTFL
jgi:hypothetical protein